MKSRIFAFALVGTGLCFLLTTLALPVKAGGGVTASDTAALLGRWDITVYYPGKNLPSWLEVTKSGVRFLVGRWVGTGGSARPISRVTLYLPTSKVATPILFSGWTAAM